MQDVNESQQELMQQVDTRRYVWARISYSVQVDSTDVGKHLQACEDMLQRHALHEADITVTRVGGTHHGVN